MTAINSIPHELWTLAFGCFRGDRKKVHGVFRVAFEGASLRTAAKEIGVDYLALRRDRILFHQVLQDYKVHLEASKAATKAATNRMQVIRN